MKQFSRGTELLEIFHHRRQFLIDQNLPMFDVTLADKIKDKLAAAFYFQMFVLKRRDPVCPVVTGALFGSDTNVE